MVKTNDQLNRKGNSSFPFRRLIIPGIFVFALFLVTVLRDRPEPGPDLAVWAFSGPTMGTTYTVKVVAHDLHDRSKLAIHTAIRDSVDAVDNTMSTYKKQSELSRFNSAGTEEFEVSENLVEVLAVALEVAGLSDGALDVTIGPLVDAWGFGPESSVEMPDEAELDVLRAITGWQKIVVDRENRTVRKTVEGLRVDLSSIAKGYAVDLVLSEILGLGYGDVMVEIGGEVRTAGVNEFAQPWRIGIERPDEQGQVVGFTVDISNRALATSGDYRNFRDVDGRRLSHIIDPRTGQPVNHTLASVSIVADSCVESDAWATALTVLGPEEGLAVANHLGLDALFIVRVGDGFDVFHTGDFHFERIMEQS